MLCCAAGLSHEAVAAELGVHAATAGKWRRRFVAEGLAGLLDEPRPGAPRRISDEPPRRISDEQVELVLRRTQALEADITAWAEHWNADPRPYVWTKTADEILTNLARYRERISDSEH